MRLPCVAHATAYTGPLMPGAFASYAPPHAFTTSMVQGACVLVQDDWMAAVHPSLHTLHKSIND